MGPPPLTRRRRRLIRAARRNVVPAVVGLGAAVVITLHASAVALAPLTVPVVNSR
jgi:hypothetical protein